MSEAPALVGRYTVERELGSGGMGEVYLAYSPAGDPVAVKVIRGDRLDPVTRARFEKEALIARTVVGTNRVARFLDADPYTERPWLAMEYVPGQTLLAHVDAHGALSAPLVASLGALLAEGLTAVHDVGLVHRDLKPQNVMLGQYGPILIDFGLGAFLDAAKETLSHSGMIIGTVRCMPPEQARGRTRVTSPADVYGLGTVLLYAATGHYPYEGARWEAIVGQVANRDHSPDLSGLPDSLAPLVERMLAYDPEDRPSLDAVTASCTRLLRDAGLSPAQARHALIDVTVTAEAGIPRSADGLSSSLWERLARLEISPPGDEDDLASPLDQVAEEEPEEGPGEVPSAEGEPVERAQREPIVTSSVEPAATERRPGRVPASRRVAEELRVRYAAQPVL